ncbi:MAG: UPF0149 family protein [Acidiferrobacterales bacterium]|nr:UPF0149 family protein [Acidiferrobacterales bacterium]
MPNNVDRYTQVESTLALSGLELTVSEVHGTVIGAIANHMKSGQTPDLLRLIEPNADSNDGRFRPLSELLYEIYRENSEYLLEAKEGFELLLPDDEEAIEIRAEALASWSKGYLLGLLYNESFSIDQLPENAPEIVRDVMQISEAAAGADGEQEEGWALAELEEYVKVGSQLVFEFIYSERAKDAPQLQQ